MWTQLERILETQKHSLKHHESPPENTRTKHVNLRSFTIFSFFIFHFFRFFKIFLCVFFFFVFFSSFFSFSPLPPGLPKTSLFHTQILILRHDSGCEKKKKEGRSRKKNAPTETGPRPQSHAQELFVIRVRGNPSLRLIDIMKNLV